MVLSIVFISLTFILYSIKISKDIFNPLMLFVLPILIAIVLHSLQLSDYYIHNDKTVMLSLYLIPIVFSLGYILFFIIRKNTSFNLEYNILQSKINAERLHKAIILINTMAILVFLIESQIVTPALISNTPTYSYMHFGLPVLHHFVNLLLLSISLSVVNYKLFNKKKLFYFTLLLTLLVFTFIMARMMIVLTLLIVFFTFYYFSKKNYIKFLMYSIIIILIFYYGFTFLGELRTLTSLNDDYFYDIANFNDRNYPSSFVQLYIYLTVNIQNLYNLLVMNVNYYFGMYTFFNILPLLNPNNLFGINFIDFQVNEGLTTFMFGRLFILDFAYCFLFFIFLFGYFIAYLYYNFMKLKIFFIFFYLVVVIKGVIMAFFSDALFGSSFLINAIVILITAKYIKMRKKNENIISK